MMRKDPSQHALQFADGCTFKPIHVSAKSSNNLDHSPFFPSSLDVRCNWILWNASTNTQSGADLCEREFNLLDYVIGLGRKILAGEEKVLLPKFEFDQN